MVSFDLPKGYEDLEISTQIIIRDALKLGIDVDIIDRKENFLRLKKGTKQEFVKEATKTRLDSLMTYLVMENKIASKLVLQESQIRVPIGKHYASIQKAIEDFDHFKNIKKVIKPATTNFGIGIGILDKEASREMFNHHLEIAFQHSTSVIIEEFIEGPEYRFLVLGDEVVAVCNRVPANVVGDGSLKISELISLKNQDPRRGEGHKTPLERIQMSDVEREILEGIGYNFETIPKKDEIVYLRKNSNISTGGDSVDKTDFVHPGFKEIAIRSAKAANAIICGIDIISSQIEKKPNPNHYAILEINFNPVLYIHEFPYSGIPRAVGIKVLELLGF